MSVMPSLRARTGASDLVVRTAGALLPVIADEHALVRRIQAGDEAAFEELYYAFFQPLCAFVLGYVGAHAIAEEIVQDLLAAIWRRRSHWEVSGGLRKYLFGAARNRAYNSNRDLRIVARWHERAAHEAGVAGMGQGSGPADASLHRGELAAALDHAMRRLPERQRQAFDLRWRGFLTHAEIAGVMDISVKGVENTLRKAFKALRKDLAAFV